MARTKQTSRRAQGKPNGTASPNAHKVAGSGGPLAAKAKAAIDAAGRGPQPTAYDEIVEATSRVVTDTPAPVSEESTSKLGTPTSSQDTAVMSDAEAEPMTEPMTEP